MPFWVWIIVGVLLWQAVVVVVAVVSNEKTEAIIFTGMGVWLLLWNGLMIFILRPIHNRKLYKNVRSIVWRNEYPNTMGHCCPSKADHIRVKSGYTVNLIPLDHEFLQKFPDETWKHLYGKGGLFWGGHKRSSRYTPKEVWQTLPKFKP